MDSIKNDLDRITKRLEYYQYGYFSWTRNKVDTVLLDIYCNSIIESFIERGYLKQVSLETGNTPSDDMYLNLNFKSRYDSHTHFTLSFNNVIPLSNPDVIYVYADLGITDTNVRYSSKLQCTLEEFASTKLGQYISKQLSPWIHTSVKTEVTQE